MPIAPNNRIAQARMPLITARVWTCSITLRTSCSKAGAVRSEISSSNCFLASWALSENSSANPRPEINTINNGKKEKAA